MGAEIRWKVQVIVAAEDYVEVSAVTASEAMEKAAREPGVIRVLEALDWRRPEDSQAS